MLYHESLDITTSFRSIPDPVDPNDPVDPEPIPDLFDYS
jgi:hypothetical protein